MDTKIKKIKEAVTTLTNETLIDEVIIAQIEEAQEEFLMTHLEDQKKEDNQVYTTEEKYFLRNTFTNILNRAMENIDTGDIEKDYDKFLDIGIDMTNKIFKKAKDNNYF